MKASKHPLSLPFTSGSTTLLHTPSPTALPRPPEPGWGLGTLSGVETHGGGPLAGKLMVMGKMLHESGGFEEVFLAKSTIPSLGILVCQGVLSNDYIDTTQLGEGAAEQSAACKVHGLGTPPRPRHGDGYNLLLIPASCCRGETLCIHVAPAWAWCPEGGIFLPHILLPAQQPCPQGANGRVAPRISPTCHPINYLLANPS